MPIHSAMPSFVFAWRYVTLGSSVDVNVVVVIITAAMLLL